MKGAFCDSTGYWQAIFQEREEGSQKEFWLLYLKKNEHIKKGPETNSKSREEKGRLESSRLES